MTQPPYTSQGVSSCLRLKCDGSFDPVTGLTGGGDAVKDIEGTILIEGRFPCVATSTLMAVALALLEGLRQALQHSLHTLDTWTDCLQLVNCINSNPKVFWDLKTIILDILSSASRLNIMGFNHFDRTLNPVAYDHTLFCRVQGTSHFSSCLEASNALVFATPSKYSIFIFF